MQFTVKDLCETITCGWETSVTLLNKNGHQLYEDGLNVAKEMLKNTGYYTANITNIKIETTDDLVDLILTLDYF